MRALAQYIMRGRMQAMLVAVAMAILSLILPPMNYLSSAVIGLVTLRRGWQEGLIIIAGAGAVMALFSLAPRYNPGGCGQEFHSLRLGREFALGTVAVMRANVLAGDRLQEIAANMIIVMVAVYLLPGLGLLHGVVAAMGAHPAWLAGIYVLGVFVLPQLALLLATLAFADSWVDFRGRLQKKNEQNCGGVCTVGMISFRPSAFV